MRFAEAGGETLKIRLVGCRRGEGGNPKDEDTIVAKLKKVFFSEDGCVLFFWLDTGALEWILLPDVSESDEEEVTDEKGGR